MMREISLEELKSIQMDILEAVDGFCSEHGIRYSMSCGTMLGAIRHGGYIPWDDDIDIYMLREDYNKFEQCFPENYEGHYSLASLNRMESWVSPFSKVYDNRTETKELRSQSSGIGVNIDIFPIDEVPDDEEEWLSYNKERRAKILDLRHSGMVFSKMNSLIKNCAVLFYRAKFMLVSRKELGRRCERFAQIHNGKGYGRVFETTLGMSVKHPFAKVLFNELEYIPFEDRKFKGFKDHHEFLSCVFGENYMTPPPMEKRVSEHTMTAYWKE